MKIDKTKIYYDITHSAELHPDSRQTGKIIWDGEDWICDKYDYVITSAELLEGLKLGWATEKI